MTCADRPDRFRLGLLAPKRLGVWLTAGAVWGLSRLPYRPMLAVGRAIGRGLHRSMGDRRRIVEANLARCFPDWEASRRRDLVGRHFESLGMGILETGLGWWSREARLRRLVRIDGLEHLESALARGKGVILLSAHFTTFELGLALLGLFQPIHMMYRQSNDPALEYLVRRGRLRRLEHLLLKGDVEEMQESLARNRAVWYAPDQNYNRRHRVFAPLFAERASTMTATSWLAGKTGAAVVPYYPHRLPDAAGYELVLLPALEDFPSGDDAADAVRINRLLETQIRRSPEQYLWLHRRFKSRPPGEAPVY